MKVIALILIIQFTFAWWCGGHMLVAYIAKQNLIKDAPDILRKASDLSNELKTSDHKTDDFVTSACWMDDIKKYTRKYNTWHFTNAPVTLDNIKPTDDPNKNSWQVLEDAKKILNTPSNLRIGLTDDYPTRPFYTRAVIHIIGDMHQPLHDIELFDKNFPTGDLGGNKEKIKLNFKTKQKELKELHALWDSVMGQFGDKDETRPLNAQMTKFFKTNQDKQSKIYTKDQFKDNLSNSDYKSWVFGFRDDLWKEVYGPYLLNDRSEYDHKKIVSIDKEQADKMFEICLKQIMLGGYRLAQFLEDNLK